MSENKYLLQIMQKRYDRNRENKEINEKDKEIERLNNIIETYKDANEYHQNKIEELEKALRKSHSQIYSENVMLRADNNKLNNIINTFEDDLERELRIRKENSGLEYKEYILIKSTLKKVLKNFRDLKDSGNNEG